MRNGILVALIWLVVLAATGSAAVADSNPVPDVFALRLLNPDELHGSIFRGRVQVYNPYDQQPLAGVAVRVEIEIELMTLSGDFVDGGTRTLEGHTDARGEWPIEVDLEADSQPFQLEVTATASYRGIEREAWGWAISIAGPRVILSTDKRLYQPGQTLHVRGLWLDATGSGVWAGKPVELEVRGDRGRMWRGELTTSAFGVAAAEWRIPESATAGEYQIQTVGGWAGVRISRYETARFGIEVTADRSYYLPGENAEVAVVVTAVDGTPVADAEVQLDLGEVVGEGQDAPAASAVSDAAGRAVFAVDLGGAHERMITGRYARELWDLDVEVTATDPLSRRSERASTTIRISRQPIHIYHLGSLPPIPGMPSRAWVATFYPDGEPAACDVELRGCDGESLARLTTNSYGIGRLPAEPRVLEALLEECPLATFQQRAGAPLLRLRASGAPLLRLRASGATQLELVVADAAGRRARTPVAAWDLEVGEEPALAIAGRTLWRPGEALELTLVPSKPMERVVVELLAEGGILASRELPRLEGPTPIVFAASDVAPGALRGLLTLRAYPLDLVDADRWGAAALGTRSVLYPEHRSLALEVTAERQVHRPGESAGLTFAVEGAGEAALAVAIVDRGVELRQTGEGLPGPALLTGLRRRDGRELAGWTLDRLLALEVTAAADPITADLDLLAEYLLFESYPTSLEGDVATPFGNERKQHQALFHRQFSEVDVALRPVVSPAAAPVGRMIDRPPWDEASFLELLARAGIDFHGLRDPWGSPYRVSFTIRGGSRRVSLTSAGLDRAWNTIDDFSAWDSQWPYFQPLGQTVDRAVARFFAETGGFLGNEAELARELARDGVAWSEVRDPWGRRYRLRGDVAGGGYRLEIRSEGPPDATARRRRATELAWTSKLDWGSLRADALDEAVADWLEAGNDFPQDDSEVRAALAAASSTRGDAWRDPYGRPLVFRVDQRTEYRDRIYYATPESAPRPETVTERYDEIEIVSAGHDGLPGTGDDLVVGQVSRPCCVAPPAPGVVAGALGVLAGSVVEANGGALPGIVISAVAGGREFIAVADVWGAYRLSVPPGTYRVTLVLDGFTRVVYELVRVSEGSVTALSVVLEAKMFFEQVTVTVAALQVATGTHRPRVAPSRPRGAGGPERATPRVRRDFPETLLWMPELTMTAVTGKDARAEVEVELADALTTWKLAALASTRDGRIAVVEADIPVTQPLSLDPDLPPFLTAGDEVEVPVYLHNRSPEPRTVEVRMELSPGVVVQRRRLRPVVVEGEEARRIDLRLRFAEPEPAMLRLTAEASDAADAIERTATVRSPGYQHVAAHNALLASGGELEFEVDGAALPGSARLEVTVDDGVAEHLTAAIRGLARRPTGCAEQRTSTALLSLLLLRREQAAGRGDGAGARRARANLELVRDSLVQHVAEGGGFAYWPGDKADLALTAYVLDFLHRIEALVDVEPTLAERARRWLLERQQVGSGRPSGATPAARPGGTMGGWLQPWAGRGGAGRGGAGRGGAGRGGDPPLGDARLTAWVTHVLSRGLTGDNEADDTLAAAVGHGLDFLGQRLGAETGDPYALAHAILAGIAVDRDVDAWVARLRSLAREQRGGAYWQLQSHTPFYGWGAAGRLETTAVAVEALLAVDPEDPLARRGLAFLLLAKDADGMWLSTQATARVLHALVLGLPADDPPAPVRDPAAPARAPRLLLDGEPWSPEPPSQQGSAGALSAGRHRLRVDGATAGRWALMRATVRSVVPWDRLREVVTDSRSLRYQVDCGGQDPVQVGRPVECRVEVERVGSRGYGMLIAEIGLPPGADVDRRSLDQAVAGSGWSFQRYEVWPDRVIAYLWPRAGGLELSFTWRPRLVERAAATASILYDYYNPEARVVLEPEIYHVRGTDAPDPSP